MVARSIEYVARRLRRKGVVLAEVVVAMVVLATFLSLTATMHRTSRQRRLETLSRLETLASVRQRTTRALAVSAGQVRRDDGQGTPASGPNVAILSTAAKYEYAGTGDLVMTRHKAKSGETDDRAYEVILGGDEGFQP